MNLSAPASDDLTAAVLNLIDDVTTASDLAAFAQLTCEGILRLLPSLSVSYNELNPLAGRAHAIIVPDPGPGWFRTFRAPFEAHITDNPLVTHFTATGDTRVLAWGDPGVGTVVGTALDETFYRPNGIRSQAAMMLPAPPEVVIGIAVNRGPEGFQPEERRLLALLQPHLVHAYRAVQLRADARLLSSVLGEHGWAVVLVDRAGRVVRSSPGAVTAAARYGLDVADGAQLASGPLERIRQLLREPSPASPTTASTPVPVVGPAGTLAAVLVPSVVGPHVVLLRPHSASPTTLVRAGLTPRQAEVALALAAGESNAQIARRLRISPATVKKHLEGVFARLQVANRASAVAKITAMR